MLFSKATNTMWGREGKVDLLIRNRSLNVWVKVIGELDVGNTKVDILGFEETLINAIINLRKN